MRVAGTTRTFALLGHPVARSRSPGLHAALSRHHDVDAVYVCFDVPPGRAEAAVAAVRTLGLAGVNLTVPLKERVRPFLDGETPAAARAGAVNTLFWDGDRLMGDNTDGAGLLDSVVEAGGVVDGPAVVLGAGGTGRAVAAALLAAGSPRVTLLNRSAARAEAVAAELGAQAGPLEASAWRRAIADARLVVNCTAGAAAPGVRALPADLLRADATWVDVNYWMPDPPGASACAARGIRFVTGHGMLLHQGVRAWQRWTGHTAAAAAIEAARAAVEGRA